MKGDHFARLRMSVVSVKAKLIVLLCTWMLLMRGSVLYMFDSPNELLGELLGLRRGSSCNGSSNHTVDGASKVAKILEELRLNGTSPCHHVSTKGFKIVGLPAFAFDDQKQAQKDLISIEADVPFNFLLISLTENGTQRCAGGDYYETDLAGDRWKSRPSVEDHGNGTYSVSFLVDGAYAGKYNFSANLLFSNYHGLELEADQWAVQPSLQISKTVEFEVMVMPSRHGGAISSRLRQCKRDDMQRGHSEGRWTRARYNQSCQAGPEGRFDECSHDTCAEPWCDGRVARLESNGWVYSSQCAFHVWERDEAWDCLAGRWLFFWGDSNMQDFIRNLLLFVLDYPVPGGATISNWALDRAVEQFFINPRRPDQALHVSLVFNGHHHTYGDDLGLDSLLHPEYREHLQAHFNGSSAHPDAFIFNSGLHDGNHFPSLAAFISAIDHAVGFWKSLFHSNPPHDIVLRTSVSPAGASRYMKSNPYKMEVFNAAMVEHFQNLANELLIIDAFDSSYPFHFDHSYSDGGHYGRAPNFRGWPWRGRPHYYFVDLMLVHMMLTSICPNHT